MKIFDSLATRGNSIPPHCAVARGRFSPVMLVALMIAACSEPPTSLESIQNAAPSNQVVAGSPDTPVTFDDSMVQLAETVPGFAGFFVDQAGEVHALSRDMSSRASIVEALDAFLSRN